MEKASRRQMLERVQAELTAARILTFAAEARRHGAWLVEDLDEGIVRLVGIPEGWRVRKVTLAEVVVLVAKQHESGAEPTMEELDALLWRGIYTGASRIGQTR
jgi:hypothetical protein